MIKTSAGWCEECADEGKFDPQVCMEFDVNGGEYAFHLCAKHLEEAVEKLK